MPTRVLRPWLTSEAMDSLSPQAEVFFVRLIMVADDYGSYWANVKLLKSGLFPLKAYSEVKVGEWLDECITAGRVMRYDVGGKQYIRILDFGQRMRNMKNRFPEPENGYLDNPPQVADKSPRKADNPPPDTRYEKLDTDTEKETRNEKAASADLLVLPFDSVEFSTAWLEWMQYRTEAKKKLTPLSAKKQLALLGARPEKIAIAMINQSIQNGWQGIFEIKTDSNGGFNKNKQHLFGIATSIAERYGADGPGKKG